MIEKFSIAAVWTTSPPPSIHLAGLWLEKTNRIKWFADFRDPWEVEAPEDNSERWRKRQKKLKRLLSATDGVTAVNDCLNEFLSTLSGTANVTTVFNGFDPEIVNLNTSPSCKVFKLVYGGTLNASHNPELFLKALSRWRKEKKRDFRLLLVGKILGLPVADWLYELGLSGQAELFGYLPHRQAVEKLLGANLTLLFLPTDEGHRLTIPAKLFEYVGLGKPVLAVASEKGAVAEFFSRYPIGTLCNREGDIVEKLEFYYQQWENGTLPILPETLRTPFGWDKQAEKLSSLIESRLK